VKHYDITVIGSGGGTKIAFPAAAMGLRVALIEEGRAGGTCLNRGCIPSKMLIYPNELAARIRDAGRIDIEMPGPPRVDFQALVTRTTETVDGISRSLDQKLRTTPNLDYYAGHAAFVSNNTVSVDGSVLSAEKIFIATGSRPRIPSIDGLSDVPYMTSTDALRRTDLPRRLIVIGAGYIATELGFAYAAAGVEVDFIVRSRFLRQEDREIADEFGRIFSETHRVHQGWQPRRVRPSGDGIQVECEGLDGKAMAIDADALLVATGVTPNTENLALENTGVVLSDDGHVVVDDHLRSRVDGIYALGDVVGRYLFRHTVNYEGEYLVRTALRGETGIPIDYGPVPHAVFAYPEIAGVGAREQDLKAAGADYVVGRSEYADSNQGLARGCDHGLCKILVDRGSHRLLGAHIVGEEAADMIHLFIVHMKLNGTLEDLLDTIFIHPALPEIARDAARDAVRKL